MGRHADPDSASFYRSLAVAAFRGLLAVVLAAALYVALASIGRPPASTPGPAVDTSPRGEASG